MCRVHLTSAGQVLEAGAVLFHTERESLISQQWFAMENWSLMGVAGMGSHNACGAHSKAI